MKKRFSKNEHGIRVKKCCASCRRRKITEENGRTCGLNGKQVKGCDLCRHWEMSRRLHNAGMSGGQIKSWRYLSYYRQRWIGQREALIDGRITAHQLLSTKEIRREFEKEHDSIYLDF